MIHRLQDWGSTFQNDDFYPQCFNHVKRIIHILDCNVKASYNIFVTFDFLLNGGSDLYQNSFVSTDYFIKPCENFGCCPLHEVCFSIQNTIKSVNMLVKY